MGTIGYAASYNYTSACFHNQHVQSGFQNVAYDSFKPASTQSIVMDLDANDMIYQETLVTKLLCMVLMERIYNIHGVSLVYV